MKLTNSFLNKLIQEEIENQGEYSNPGECAHDFFGILIGYLGGDEDAARYFCEILHSSRSGTPSQMLQHAMREFNIEADAAYEIEAAYQKVYGQSIDGGKEEELPFFRESVEPAEASRFDAGNVKEEKKCDPGKSRCTDGKCRKNCNETRGLPTGAVASVDLHEEFKQIVREELGFFLCEGEVVDFQQQKMLGKQKQMIQEPEWYFVDIDVGRAEVQDLEAAIRTAIYWTENGFTIKDASPEVMDALTGLSEDPEVSEGNKASKTVGEPPYREQGATESQAQQKAAGMALSARRGDTPVSKLKGAALALYHNEITTKELKNLAKLGQKVKQHKSKEPKHLKSLPGHATHAKD